MILIWPMKKNKQAERSSLSLRSIWWKTCGLLTRIFMVSGLYRPCRLIARSLQARVFVYHLMEMCSSVPGIYEPVGESSSKLTIFIKNWTKKIINFIFEQATQLREIGTTFRQSVSKYSCHMIFLSLVAWCKRVNSYPYQKGLYPYIFFSSIKVIDFIFTAITLQA